MKRVTKILFAAILAAATYAAIMVGCKKEEIANRNGVGTYPSQLMSASEEKVLDFLADINSTKRGMKVDGEALCLEDFLWYCETTVNYCYGFPDEIICDIRMDTIRVALPKYNKDGNFEYNDALEFYSKMVNALREAYTSIDIKDKTLQFVMMSIESYNAKDNPDDLVIIMNVGSNSNENSPGSSSPDQPWYVGLFNKDDNWIWGFQLGKCDSTVLESDASDQLTLAIANYDFAHGSLSNPCENCHPYFLVGPNIEEMYVGNADSIWPFYDSGLSLDETMTRCIPGEELEMYYENIMLNTHTESMETNPFGYYGYYETVVIDMIFGPLNYDNYQILHRVYVLYATRAWRNDNGTYPIPIDGDEN